ncbi:STAS domain-containing protein [Streptomyces kanasensis]|uniref:STAS domain-containing protein n=1 Tax=Streptomyces kanasensis TaxID=936756 RepID=UPI0036F62197
MTTPLTPAPGRRPYGTALLTAVGEVDTSNADPLAVALDTAHAPVVLDLTEVGYLDSAGLHVSFSRADRLELVTGPLLAPVLAVSGLTELTTVRPA